MVIGPVERSLSYPDHPPRRAIVQAAQARLVDGYGFFCLLVRPCSRVCSASRTGDLPSVKNVRGRLVVGLAAARASTSCMVMVAPTSAITASFSRAVPSSMTPPLKANPSAFDGSWKSCCSPCRRWRALYQPITVKAWAVVRTGVGCQRQAPQDRRLAGRWIDFAHLDGATDRVRAARWDRSRMLDDIPAAGRSAHPTAPVAHGACLDAPADQA